MLIDRLQVTFTGGPIGNGVATHYAVSGFGHQPDFRAFWLACSSITPITVHTTVPGYGDTIEVETGLLQSVWSDGNPLIAQAGQESHAYPAGVGACINWMTDGIVNGRRVRGRTFVVPLDGTRYDTDGTIEPTALSILRTAASDLLTACGEHFVIYHRPVDGAGGSAHAVTDYSVADRVSTLRSRR